MDKPKAKILVVEDDPDEAQMMEMALRLHGYQVALAADGQQGIANVMAQRPDLIILDVMMPVLDGFAMCSRLHRDPDFSDIPVILVTGIAKRISETTYSVDDFLRGEADDYLEKPITPAELIETVERWVR